MTPQQPAGERSKNRRQLKRLHGTPKEFEDAVWNALGDISVSEARTAIEEYNLEWRNAKP